VDDWVAPGSPNKQAENAGRPPSALQKAGICGNFVLVPICEKRARRGLSWVREGAFMAAAVRSSGTGQSEERSRERMGSGRNGKTRVTCDDCFFRCNLLCALDLEEPCATFRPNTPEGLKPPRQLRFVFRQERQAHAVWAFPSPEEQAAAYR
jgi:hypothetical protein